MKQLHYSIFALCCCFIVWLLEMIQTMTVIPRVLFDFAVKRHKNKTLIEWVSEWASEWVSEGFQEVASVVCSSSTVFGEVKVNVLLSAGFLTGRKNTSLLTYWLTGFYFFPQRIVVGSPRQHHTSQFLHCLSLSIWCPFSCPQVTLCIWHDVKIQSVTH